MCRCAVTLSANAGVVLALDGYRLWVDALHKTKVPGFSTLSPADLQTLWGHPAFAAPDALLFTHCHPDHYDKDLTAQAITRYPQAAPLLPEPEFPGVLPLHGPRDVRTLPGLRLEFARLTHEGPQFAAVPHYGCLVEQNGFRVLITGDCAVAGADLADWIGGRSIDLALLDFPWVTLRRGREFINAYIRPRHLVVNHLPFREDEVYNYLSAAAKCAALMRPTVPDVRLLTEPFQTEAFE